MMQMVASFAELERAIVRERTSAGVAAALAELRVGGRRKRLGPAERSETAEGVNTDRKSGAALQPQCTGRVRHRRPTPNRLGLECSFGQHPGSPGDGPFSLSATRCGQLTASPFRRSVRWSSFIAATILAHTLHPSMLPAAVSSRSRAQAPSVAAGPYWSIKSRAARQMAISSIGGGSVAKACRSALFFNPTKSRQTDSLPRRSASRPHAD